MQLDQLLQGNNIYVLLGVCCCGLCVFGLAISIIAPILDIVMGIVGMLLDFASTLFGVGPIPGCGCVVVLALIASILVVGALTTSILSTCGTAQATNFCMLFGR
ncbi:MAG: hypothetical protein U0452_10180 [Anaerolineae bacterium]